MDGFSGARLIIPRRRRQGVIIFIVRSREEEKSGRRLPGWLILTRRSIAQRIPEQRHQRGKKRRSQRALEICAQLTLWRAG
jgi:hypothetical protein